MKKTTFRIEMREAVGDNAAHVLNIDPARPGAIYASIDYDVHVEISDELAKRANRSDEIVLAREGYAVEMVTFNTTLRDLFTAEILPFDHDAQIDAWAAELESLAQYLRESKALSHVKAAGMRCRNCYHTLLDHERPDSSPFKCQRPGCDCRGFFPIGSKPLN
jgi:hypothetical protein